MSSLRQGELETAAAIRGSVDRREVRVTELVERALERMEAWQPVINAFSQRWADEALEAARRVDGRRTGEGGGDQALIGVPLAVKDLFDVAGYRTTGCCAAYRDNVPAEDAWVIARMREAGVVMVGKTNQHELAAGGTNTVSACGRTGNPWDPARMTGGSSGGSAAAVAAGIVPLALGSDTGGSIRIPSAMCGTFGLKPTTGAIPTTGLMPLAPSMDCPGPIARTVEDLHVLFMAMRGGEPVATTDDEGTARPLRVAIPDGFFAERIHQDVREAVRRAGETFERTGVEVESVDGTGIRGARHVWMDVCTPEFHDAHPLPEERLNLVHPSVLAWWRLGERMSDEERDRARRRREEIARWFRHRLQGFDALLISTTPYPAPGFDQEVVQLGPSEEVRVSDVGPGWITCSVNLAGLPALNLPAARSSDGLPLGVSLVGKDHDELMLFRLAHLWEEASAYRREMPALPA